MQQKGELPGADDIVSLVTRICTGFFLINVGLGCFGYLMKAVASVIYIYIHILQVRMDVYIYTHTYDIYIYISASYLSDAGS